MFEIEVGETDKVLMVLKNNKSLEKDGMLEWKN